MQNLKRIGSITELKVIAELMEYGEVSIPYGNNARYDCILDIEGRLIKIQIKTAHKINDNKFSVPFCNKRIGKKENVRKIYTSDEVDFIATYYENKLYLFPTGNHTNLMTISYNYPTNGIKQPINLASDYYAEKFLKF